MKKNRVYFKLGLMLLCVVLASVAFTVVLSNLQGFFDVIRSFLGILSPVLFGILFAYLMNPVMQFVENGLLFLIARARKNDTADFAKLAARKRTCHIIGVILSLTILLLIFYLAISLIVPTVIANISSIINPDTVIGFYNRIVTWLHQLLSDRPAVEKWVLERIDGLYTMVEQWASGLDLGQALISVTTQVYGAVKGALNFFLGLVIAIYMLLSKEKFLAQTKKLVIAMFPEKHANRLLEVGRRTNKIFSGFVQGKIIDSMIIGMICYIVMSIIGLPYPMLISVIIGVTNVIPFFGPLIGAIPSAFLILLYNPFQCFVFVIFIIILQQFDGNFLGPRILGDSVGLSSFWILISITVFSGLFGFSGMIFGVPVFALLYMLISDAVKSRLEKKNYPTPTDIYTRVKSTDDIVLAQKMAEVAAERAAFHEDDSDVYEDEPEIIDLDQLEDEDVEHFINRMDDSEPK